MLFRSSFNTNRIDHIYEDPHSQSNNFILHYGDMTDSTNLIRIVAEVQPDEIYNLAAQSHVQVSFETAEYTANADALGVTRILESIRLLGLQDKTKFYQASTSEMFGLCEPGTMLNEDSPFYPRSPYGIAKLYAHWITKNYREAYNLFAVSGILFNHESPRRGETFVTRKIVRAAVAIRNGQLDRLYLGNLDAVRDWGHARDYIEGMWLMLQAEKAEDYVLATGHAITVRQFCEKVFNKLGINLVWTGVGADEKANDLNGETRVQIDANYFRPTEVPFLLGDSSKANKNLGWKPRINIDSLIDEMITDEIQKSLTGSQN